jgi:hypothetical protein
MTPESKNAKGKNPLTKANATAAQQKNRNSKAQNSANNKSLMSTLDDFFGRNMNRIFFVSVLLTVFFGIFLFDVKISTGGDDSNYIEMADNFIKGKAFPTWHGPLYSVFLSIPMLLFGVNVVLLKIVSFIFIIAHLVLFYFTFRRYVSPTIFSLVLLIVSVNSTILYFASQTYSEAMYMFLQSLSIFLFIKIYHDSQSDEKISLKNQFLQWLILGFFVFLASLTRNIGIVGLIAMIFFLLIEKKFREAIMLAISYCVFLFPFKLYKSIVWSTGQASNTQLSEILLKNSYNKALGSEDFSGMVTRFLENCRLYLSKHFMIGLGLHDPASTDKSWFVTIVVIAFSLLALYYAFKHSKIMLFIAVYLAASIAATFIALQQSWDQMRMVIIYIPMLLLLLAWGVQQLGMTKGYSFINFILPLFLAFILYKTFGQTTDIVKVNRKVLARNIKGNKYYGFTPDWQNYLVMSEWVSKNIPQKSMVAARKPSVSFIYGNGRDFYGIYRFPVEPPADLIHTLSKRTGTLTVIPNKVIESSLPADLQTEIKKSVVAYVAEGAEIYSVNKLNDAQGEALNSELRKRNISTFSADSLLNKIKASAEDCYAVSPDSLISSLRRNKVEYVIVASLRANPKVNTGNVINNIQRYLYFVQLKYPGILSLVHQTGSNDQEPAWLYKLNYDYYGM